MSATAVPASTKIHVFRNGDRNYFGKTVVISRRQMVDMEKLLDSITTDVGLPEAGRFICTPIGGTRVNNVTDLQASKNYVVVGKGNFKRLPYLDLATSHSEWLRSCSKRRQRNIEPVEHKNSYANAQEHRVVKSTRGGITFFVYCNGAMYEPARRILLNEHILALPWKDICAEISQSLNAPFGAIKRLYTINGVCVKNSRDLEANEQYVAVGRYAAFQHLNYGTLRKPFSVTANKQTKELESMWRLQGISEEDETSVESSEHSKTSHHTTKTRRRPARRLPPVIYADGRTVFHTKPVSHKRKQSKQKPVDFNKDDDIFRAGARDETKDAEEVEEIVLTESETVQPDDVTDHKQVHHEEDLLAGSDIATVESRQLNGHKYVNNVEYGDDITESGYGARDAPNDDTTLLEERDHGHHGDSADVHGDDTEQSGGERGERDQQVNVSNGTGDIAAGDEQQQNEEGRSDASVGTDDRLSRTASIHVNENGVFGDGTDDK